MSATKSKPAGRAVGVRQVAPMDKQICAWMEIPTKHLSKGRRSNFVVTGYTGSARRLKRLVEIAGMDEDELFALLHRNGLTEYGARCALEGFGLSTAQGRKGKRS